jgi:hypothetical protein
MRLESAQEAVATRIDAALAVARDGAPAYLDGAINAVHEARNAFATRAIDVLALDRDESEARSAALNTAMTQTISAALLLEQASADPRAALVALRYIRRHLVPDQEWSDRIAITAGRDLLAYDDVDDAMAAKAAA